MAIQDSLTDSVMNNLYNSYIQEQKRSGKKLSFQEFIEMDKIYNKIMQIHRKVYSYVNKHGGDKEWKGKWGNKF